MFDTDFFVALLPCSQGDCPPVSKLIRTAKLDAIISAAKRLADRLLALYPTQKEALTRPPGRCIGSTHPIRMSS